MAGDCCSASGVLLRLGIGFRLLIRAARELPLVRLKRVSGGGRAVVFAGAAAAAAAAFFLFFSSSSRATQSQSPESHLLRTI